MFTAIAIGSSIGLIILITQYFKRKTVSSVILITSSLAALILSYYGFQNPTGRTVEGPIYVALLLFTFGVFFYIWHMRAIGDADFFDITGKISERKIDQKTLRQIYCSLEAFLKFNSIPIQDEVTRLVVPASGPEGIEVQLTCSYENLLMHLNGHAFFFNFFELGKESAIAMALDQLHACLCSTTTLTINLGKPFALELLTYVDDEIVELYRIGDLFNPLKVAVFRNNYISSFRPRSFPMNLS